MTRMCELNPEYRPTFTVIARSGTSLGFACSENAACLLLTRFALLFPFLCLEAKSYAQEEVPEKWRAAALSKVDRHQQNWSACQNCQHAS